MAIQHYIQRIIGRFRETVKTKQFKFWAAVGVIKLVILILLVVFLWMVFGRIL